MPTDDEDVDSNTTASARTVPPDADPAKFPTAFAARVGDRNLWIANGGAIDPEHLSAMNLNPEYVVSVNRTATRATTDHHPLKDGYINDQQDFSAAVETTRERIHADGTVIVNCAAGISRSSTVIATAIAAEDDLSFEDAVEEIRDTRPRARPHPKLQLNAHAYLVNIENRSESRDQLSELAESAQFRAEDSDIIDDLLD
jgi:atypical dual specificity phosphatase